MTDNPQLFNRHGGYITEGKYDMRRLAAFLFLDVRKAHWCPAVDLVNTCLQETAAKVRHTLITAEADSAP